MQLELGQLIIDAHEGYRDTGVVIEIYEDCYGDNIYSIFWVCPRDRGHYTTTLAYTEEELDMEYSHCFEVIR
tara:strand:+ start:4467 stop:4682 length:216 start_codon:yes stop_codon:yes gene_type:complete